MFSSIGRELKDTVGDGLRGMRHLVRALCTDAPKIRVANAPLPEIPVELDWIVGRTFRAVDDVMTAVETIASPFRPTQSGDPAAIKPFSVYFRQQSDAETAPIFAGDVYSVLKRVARQDNSNPLIRKGRLAGVHADLAAKLRGGDTEAALLCAALFLSLTRRQPLQAPEDAAVETWRTYAAVALIFGLGGSGRLAQEDIDAVIGDALLMSGLRLSVFVDAAEKGHETEDLQRVCASLLQHLP